MTKQPFFELQKAIFDTLCADDSVMEIIGLNEDGQPQIYDGVPENARYPYLIIGEDSFSRQDWFHIAEPTVTCMTNENGRLSPVKMLSAAVQSALNTQIEVEGFTTTEWSYEETDFWREGVDGTEAGVVTFRYLLDPDESQ